LSFPFSATYGSSDAKSLKKIPKNVKILFITGETDRFGKKNEEGYSLDNAYAFIDKTLGDRDVWKVAIRHASHGSSVPEEYGGSTAADANLRIAGEVAASWLMYESGEDESTAREGVVYYDLKERRSIWTDWHQTYNLKTAKEWGI